MATMTAPVALRDFVFGHFQPLVGQSMTFLRPSTPNVPPEAIQMELVKVDVPAVPSRSGLRAPFSLLFLLTDAQPLNDRELHTLSHPGFEVCDLLLSRVMPPGQHRAVPVDRGMFYEIVFA
jgi:hypothetical protein